MLSYTTYYVLDIILRYTILYCTVLYCTDIYMYSYVSYLYVKLMLNNHNYTMSYYPDKGEENHYYDKDEDIRIYLESLCK